MKRKKIEIDEILKRHLPRMSDEQIEKAGAEVWQRLQEHFQKSPEDFNFGRPDDSPAGKAIRRLREIDGLVLRAIQILEDKADMIKIFSIVNELGEEPVDLDNISMSLKRLDKNGAISLRTLFPRSASMQDAVPEPETFKAGNPAKERL